MKTFALVFLTVLSSAVFAQDSKWLWATGGDSIQTPATVVSIAADGSGRSVICGMYYGPMSISGHFLDASPGYRTDLFVASYEKNGSILWVRRLGSVPQNQGEVLKIILDRSQNAYVFGYYQNEAEFGDTSMKAKDSTSIFAAKYDPDGKRLWVRTLVKNVEWFDSLHPQTYTFSVCCDSGENIFAAGSFHHSADFGGKILERPSGMFLASYSGAGKFIDAIALPDSGVCKSLQYFSADSSTFIAGQLSPNGNIFVDKLSHSGAMNWQIKGSDAYSLVEGMSISRQGSAYITGSFGDSLRFANLTLKNYSSFFDGFLLKLDTSGSVKWLEHLGGARVDQCHAVSADENDNAYVTGYFQLSASFGEFTLTHPFARDDIAFITKYDPSGRAVWAIQPTTNEGISEGESIVASGHTVLVAGRFGSDATFGSSKLGGTNGGGFFLAALDESQSAVQEHFKRQDKKLSAYPAPAGSSCVLMFDLEDQTSVKIFLIDILGRIVLTPIHKDMSEGHHSIDIDTRNLPNGMYTAIMRTNYGDQAIKILVNSH